MSDVTTVPILLDADTGYGNFNNARRLVRKLEDRGIAGTCCVVIVNSLFKQFIITPANKDFGRQNYKNRPVCLSPRLSIFLVSVSPPRQMNRY